MKVKRRLSPTHFGQYGFNVKKKKGLVLRKKYLTKGFGKRSGYLNHCIKLSWHQLKTEKIPIESFQNSVIYTYKRKVLLNNMQW